MCNVSNSASSVSSNRFSRAAMYPGGKPLRGPAVNARVHKLTYYHRHTFYYSPGSCIACQLQYIACILEACDHTVADSLSAPTSTQNGWYWNGGVVILCISWSDKTHMQPHLLLNIKPVNIRDKERGMHYQFQRLTHMWLIVSAHAQL